jgi:hypothetical protein
MRSVGGEVTGLTLTFFVNAAATLAVGDLCALDTTANWTVTDTANDTLPLGRVVQISATAAPGSTLLIATVEVFCYRAVVSLPTNAAIAVGSSIQTNGAGSNNIEAAASWNGTLVISDPGGAGNADVLV